MKSIGIDSKDVGVSVSSAPLNEIIDNLKTDEVQTTGLETQTIGIDLNSKFKCRFKIV